MTKKIIILAAATICLFAACQKSEGVFDPGKKLSKIYSETTITYAGMEVSSGRYLSEEWNWDGDKVTRYVSYNTDGTVRYSYDFVYDGKNLTRLDANDGYYTEFIYDGKKLQEIRISYDGELTSKAVVTKRDGKKITQMTATSYEYIESYKRQMNTVLQMLMPESAAEFIATSLEKQVATKGGETTTSIDLTWTGDNITKIALTEDDGVAEMVYSYDNKSNPRQGFHVDLRNTASMSVWGSENNEIYDSIVANYGEGQTYNLSNHYEYEYDGQWPVKRTSTVAYETLTGTSTIEYEYKD